MSEIVFSQHQIRLRVQSLAQRISTDFRNQEIVLVGLLNGCILFLADLAREIECLRLMREGVKACHLDFMRVSSYGTSQQAMGRVCIDMDMQSSPEGRHVVIVDEVAETLYTTHFVVTHLQAKRPASVRVCVLIDKPDRHKLEIPLDYVGFSEAGLPFLKGYGMDNKGSERGLPHIASCDE